MVGFYDNGSGRYGFTLNISGAGLTTFGIPGSPDTEAEGANDNGWIVGSYASSNYHYHGFFRVNGVNYCPFDWGGASDTFLTAMK
jgi:hypothetical protein